MSDWNTPLTFTALEAGSTVQLTKTGDFSIDVIQYRTSTEDAWSTYTMADVITLSAVGDYVQFQNTGNTLSQAVQRFVQFVMTGSIAASGNIQALMNYREDCPNQSFLRLFQDCTALVQAPELPSANIGQYCYYQMFRSCTSLVETPELPATELKTHCYREMFYGCTSLTSAPALPATTLATSCYQTMFYGCSNLSEVKVSFTSWLDGATANWLSGVASSGNFYKPTSLPETRGTSNIPTNWTLKSEYKPLTFTAVEAGSTIYLTLSGTSSTVDGLQYRTSSNDPWSSYTLDTIVSLAEVGDYVQFQNTKQTLSLNSSNYVHYVMTGKFNASGNIQALVNYREDCPDVCFTFLFFNCTSLLTAPDLPASTLGFYCYNSLFFGCSSLTTIPKELPALTLKTGCYYRMFRSCSAITTAPRLPADSLVNFCYAGLFSGCSKLSYIDVGFKSWGSDSLQSLQGWVSGVAGSGVFYKPLALTDVRGTSRVPANWQVIDNDEIECSPGLPTLMDPLGSSAPYIRKLSYLESTGTQYIILQHPVSQDTRISVDFQGADADQSDVSPVFGAESYASYPRWWGGKGSQHNFNIILTRGSKAQILLALTEETYNGLRHTIGFDGATGFCDEERYTFPAAEISYSSLMLFGSLTRGVPSFLGKLRIYSFELDGEEYIPVIDLAGVPAFYGTSSHTFCYNQGTGIFNYG